MSLSSYNKQLQLRRDKAIARAERRAPIPKDIPNTTGETYSKYMVCTHGWDMDRKRGSGKVNRLFVTDIVTDVTDIVTDLDLLG